MAGSSAGDRTKAYRLRREKTAGTIKPIDALWLADYEEQAEKRRRGQQPIDVGASRSRSGRKVKFEMEEAAEAEAVGTGTAAAAAAAAALATKEEGRRLDSLTINAIDVLKEAVSVYKDVCLSMRKRMDQLEGNAAELLGAVRDQYLARTQAEIRALEATTGDGDALSRMAEQLLPHIMNGAKNGKPAT